jgi:predicted permease
MRRTPLLTFSAILALSVGIGLNTGIFSIVSGFWLRPPVAEDPASFVQLIPQYAGWFSGADQTTSFTTTDYEALRSRSNSLADVAAWSGGGGAGEITLDGDSRGTGLGLVSCNFFRVYGIGPPRLGRLFLPEECRTPNSAQVTVLSESLWRNRYGGDPSIVGKIIHINQNPYIVVGVVSAASAGWLRNVLWIPYTMQPQIYHGDSALGNRPWPWLTVVGRMKPGYFRANVQAELNTILREQDRLIPHRKTSLIITNGSYIEQPALRSLGFVVIPLIMVPMLLVLFVACVNVTTVLLSQAVERRGEIAIRLALGASRGRVVRTLAAESALMIASAAAISLYMSYKIPEKFWTFMMPESGFDGTNPDWHVFAFLAVVTILAACIASLVPAEEMLKVDLLTALKGKEVKASRSRMRQMVVVGQVAMSFVLVTAAVLFVRQQRLITSVDPGFDSKHVLMVSLNLTNLPRNEHSASQLYPAIQARVRELPGVESVASASIVPFTDSSPSEIRLPGQQKGQGRQACVDTVSSDFFETFAIPIVRGRAFENSDNASGALASISIVSQTFARTFWMEQDPVNKVIKMPDGREVIVVGVAKDTRSEQYGMVDMPRVYILGAQSTPSGPLMIRVSGETRSAAEAIRKTISDLGVLLPVRPRSLQSMTDERAERIRRLTDIVAFMSCVAISLAVIGLYGVIAFSLNQRTRELGIRMVLGASKERILCSVLFSGMKQIASGLLLGFALTLPMAPLWSSLSKGSPFQLGVMDFKTYVIAAVLLFIATTAPTYLSARRILSLEPMAAVRYE